MKKSTEELLNQIKISKNITDYVEGNQSEFISTSYYDLLNNYLVEKKLSLSTIADSSCLGTYVYKVFQGKRNPSQDVLLCISLSMNLSVEQTQQLLRVANLSLLDPRKQKDSIVIYGLSHSLSVPQVNDILYDILEKTIS